MAIPVTYENLERIRVLYREPDTMALWGIPYDMRPGQSPRDLIDGYRRHGAPLPYGTHGTRLSDPRGGWLYLGSPGWFGRMTRVEQMLVLTYLDKHHNTIPGGPCEWDTVGKDS